MAMETNVVIVIISGRSSITAGQWQELGRQIEKKKVDSANLQAYLDNPNRFSDQGAGSVTISKAKKILGRRNVITVSGFNRAWNHNHNLAGAEIMYSEEDLSWAAYRNKSEGDDWRLCYYGGQPIWKVQEIIGSNERHQPCFNKNLPHLYDEIDQLVGEKTASWLRDYPPFGYYLVNFKGLFSGLKYQDQENKITDKFGADFERTDPHVFTEAAMTIFMLTGERIAEKWHHRSAACDVGGKHIYVGGFGTNGWSVGNAPNHEIRKNLCVSISRKQRGEL
jgi:hypothetical protein